MTIVAANGYRLATLTHLLTDKDGELVKDGKGQPKTTERPVYYGLSIEKSTNTPISWYSICFVLWNKEIGDVEIKFHSNGYSIFNLDDEDFIAVKKLVQIATDIINFANEAERMVEDDE